MKKIVLTLILLFYLVPSAYSQTAETFFDMGKAKYDQGDYKGAIDDFNKAIKLKPDEASFYNYRGLAKSKTDDYKGEIQDYTEAIKLKPDGGLYSLRGTAKEGLGDYRGAIQDYTKVIELNPLLWLMHTIIEGGQKVS